MMTNDMKDEDIRAGIERIEAHIKALKQKYDLRSSEGLIVNGDKKPTSITEDD